MSFFDVYYRGRPAIVTLSFTRTPHASVTKGAIMKIENSVAFITGANRGIGRALVETLLAKGVKKLYAAARNPRQLEGLFSEAQGRVIPIQLDVTRPEEIEAAAKKASDINLLINNAGVLASFGVLTSPRDQIERDLRTNFFGVLDTTRAFLPSLERSGAGAVVNILTVVSLASMPGLGGYSASKAAALSLTQSLRGELNARGVRVFSVYPGPIDTDMIKGFELPKTSPKEAARAIVEGISNDQEDIAPDAMSREVISKWLRDPKQVERQFSKM